MPRVMIALGAAVLAASGVWWFLAREDDPLPEGAIASGSLTISVGDPGGGLGLGAPQIGMIAGAVVLVAGLIWGFADRTRRAGAELST